MKNIRGKNPKALMAMGIAFIAVGIALFSAVNPGAGIGLLALGIIFLVMAMKHKNDQDKSRTNDTSSEENL